MKLQTMTLPTGEFLIIASETKLPQDAAEKALVGLTRMRKLSGAAALYLTNEPVEIVDAVIQAGDARRVDVPEDPDDEEESISLGAAGGTKPARPLQDIVNEMVENMKKASRLYSMGPARITVHGNVEPADVANRIQFHTRPTPRPCSIQPVFDPDERLAEQIEDGVAFSPAGLVDTRTLTEKAASGLGPVQLYGAGRITISEADVTEVDEILSVPGGKVQTGKLGHASTVGRAVDDGPRTHQLSLEDLVFGATGEDEEPEEPTSPAAEAIVEEVNSFVEELRPNYADDTRLVDIICKIAQDAVDDYASSSTFRNGERIFNKNYITGLAWQDYVRELIEKHNV